MANLYTDDIVAWADQQAALLRSERWSLLDIEHLAEEIDDVGKTEKHRLAHRLAVLWCHLLTWQFQPTRRGSSWRLTIHEQRRALRREVAAAPSLKALLHNDVWLDTAWSDAIVLAVAETGLAVLPAARLWAIMQTLDDQFWPD